MLLHNVVTVTVALFPVLAVGAVMALAAGAAYRPRNNPISETSDIPTERA